ncbi:Dihydrofolate synthase @ Folylpolyglutamate synthase [hydrothermal vent metagenome]|uniref:Dihydrofolate synthase @ Folylpolyglutamate synthase n=1 Tax=hydrothermal vent metagenome TaxID=652676 RepID=A0A1W1BYJ5_9ZZZZ
MENSISFESFIENKPLYYKEIDHERVHKAYAILKPYILRPLVIHIVGTNGKGSTGRIMATLLNDDINRSVAHFSSPHILKFNERIWIDGKDITDTALDDAHRQLYAILGKEVSESLSYFEYTTLLAFVATKEVDVLILEAGLGGEFDATNVIEKELSVITPIGLDHQDFLGEKISDIARTKLNSIEKQALLGFQKYSEVYEIAKEIATKKGTKLYKLEKVKSNDLFETIQNLGWADYLYENTQLALKALDILNLPYNLESLKKVTLFGRFYQIAPNITIDVGHNLLATEALVKAIEKKYNKKKIILVYNSLDDKDYEAILKLFKPLIKWVEIIDIDTPRAIEYNRLTDVLDKLDIEYKKFILTNKNNNYFIFGSFYVVEAFLEKIKYNIKNQ